MTLFGRPLSLSGTHLSLRKMLIIFGYSGLPIFILGGRGLDASALCLVLVRSLFAKLCAPVPGSILPLMRSSRNSLNNANVLLRRESRSGDKG